MSRVTRVGCAAVVAAALALLPGAPAHAVTAPNVGVPEQDKQYLQAAHQSHLAVIEAGKLAEHRATNMPVRDFGIRLVTDHTELDQAVTRAAARLRVALPGGPNETQQATLDRLRGFEGTEFTAQFVLTQQDEHLRAREAAKMEVGSRRADSRAKRVAKQSLPVIESHLATLRDLAESLGMTTGGGATPSPEPSPTGAAPTPAGTPPTPRRR